MSEHSTFRGLSCALAFTAAGVLAFAALPNAAVRYVLPACFLAAAASLALFFRDFLRDTRR